MVGAGDASRRSSLPRPVIFGGLLRPRRQAGPARLPAASDGPFRPRRRRAGQILRTSGGTGLLFIGVLILMFRPSARRTKLATRPPMGGRGHRHADHHDDHCSSSVARASWHWGDLEDSCWPRWCFGGVEVTFLRGQPHQDRARAGWLPLLIAINIFTVMTTWQARPPDLVTGPTDRARKAPLGRVHPARPTTTTSGGSPGTGGIPT